MNIRTFFLSVCLFLGLGSYGQVDLQRPLPADPNTVVGKLPNGITYYIRHNEEPKDRASFYIIRNVGALLENDDQNGLAHFLEHMAFNGTKNFPGKGIITTLEKYGVTFGGNINAYTAQNETVYNISAVPATDVRLLDTCLLILHDWSYYLTLDGDEIDAERGVISEEWRTRRTPQFRLLAQTLPVLFKDSKYAERDVIGDLDIIKNFKHQTIRDFYREWYRTDLEAIAVVGDFDVARMEQRVKEIFSSIPTVENPKPRPFFEIPGHEEIYYCLATDKEVQQSSVSITTILPGMKAEEKQTHQYLKSNLLVTLCNSMIGARIGELMQQPNPPFLGGSIGFGGFMRGYDSYDISVTAKPNGEAEALEAILTENERVRRYGFTPTELERVKTNLLVGLESSYKVKDRTPNESFIKSMQAHFLEQKPMVSFDYYYDFMTRLIPTITVEDVNAKFAEGNVAHNRTVVVSGPSEGVTHLTREEVLAVMDKVAQSEIAPYQDEMVGGTLIGEELPGSKVVAEKALPAFDAVEWTLGNGAKVVFRKAGYEKDTVSLTAYSKGGTSLYDTDLLPSASNAAGFASASGVGDFDVIALGKLLKRARVKNIHGIHACKAALNFIHQRFIRYPFAVHYCRAGAALLAVCAQLHYQIIRAHAASDKRYVCPQVFYKPLLRAFHDFFIAGLLYAAVLIAASVHIKRRRLPLNEHGSTAIHYGCFYCVPACFLLHFRHGEHIICNVFNKRLSNRAGAYGNSIRRAARNGAGAWVAKAYTRVQDGLYIRRDLRRIRHCFRHWNNCYISYNSDTRLHGCAKRQKQVRQPLRVRCKRTDSRAGVYNNRRGDKANPAYGHNNAVCKLRRKLAYSVHDAPRNNTGRVGHGRGRA